MPPDAPDAWIDTIRPVGLSQLEPIYLMPVKPKGGRRRPRWALLFACLVVLPTVVVGSYLCFIASNRYLAEAHFVIRKPNEPSRGPSQGVSIDEGAKALGVDDSYSVRDFLESRDALQLLVEKGDFRSALTRADGDWLWRFPGFVRGDSDEDLYRLYQSLVTVDYESSTGLTTLYVEAFQPEDARRMAAVLMGGSEDLLNRLNERARVDALRLSESEVTRTRQEALQAQLQVTAFRDRESVIDPTVFSKTVLDTIGSMMLQLVEARAQMEVTTKASPNSPQIALFRSRINALQQQIDNERATLAGSDRSLAPRIAEYERLTLLRSFAERSYVSALNVREAARLDAQRQQDYLVQVVQPHAADEARYPKRVLWTLMTFLAGCTLFWLFRPRATHSGA